VIADTSRLPAQLPPHVRAHGSAPLRELSRKHRLKDRVERALAVVKAFSVAVPGAIQLKLEVEAASGVADSGDPEQDLSELLLAIGEVAQANRSGALFLHNLDTPALAAICIAFQATGTTAACGAGWPQAADAAGRTFESARCRVRAQKKEPVPGRGTGSSSIAPGA
jgi:hypothetical protein